MNKVYLALGSNIGDKKKYIERAIELLRAKITNIKIAEYYETKPQYHEDQEFFLNTAISGFTNLSPIDLLKFVKEIEIKTGRKPTFRNGPREIDIDILFYDDLVYKDIYLIIPHPLIEERDFVLRPLMDLDPDFVHPVLRKKIRVLYASIQ